MKTFLENYEDQQVRLLSSILTDYNWNGAKPILADKLEESDFYDEMILSSLRANKQINAYDFEIIKLNYGSQEIVRDSIYITIYDVYSDIEIDGIKEYCCLQFLILAKNQGKFELNYEHHLSKDYKVSIETLYSIYEKLKEFEDLNMEQLIKAIISISCNKIN